VTHEKWTGHKYLSKESNDEMVKSPAMADTWGRSLGDPSQKDESQEAVHWIASQRHEYLGGFRCPSCLGRHQILFQTGCQYPLSAEKMNIEESRVAGKVGFGEDDQHPRLYNGVRQ
jgi:hypothetical protein